MTTHPQQIPAPSAPATRGRRAGRITAIIIGAAIALTGALTAAGAAAALGVFGGDGEINSDNHSLSTRSSALVSDVAHIEDGVDVVGHPRLRLSVKATGPTDGLFVGVGPAKDVERYLAGASTEEVTDIDVDPFRMDRERHSGTKRPGRPAAQKFWVAQASGRDAATLRWKIRDGDYRVVLMNADGSRGVKADGDVGLRIPHLPAIAWSVLGGGLLLLAGGAALIVVAARRP